MKIVEQPQSQDAVPYGGETTISVTVTNSGTMKYEWRKDEDIISLPNCEGMDTPNLHISFFSSKYEGNYHCIVTNNTGERVESEPTKLQMKRQ